MSQTATPGNILVTNGVNPEAVPAPVLDPRESRGQRFVGTQMHGLTGTDNLVLNGFGQDEVGKPAWHGMGLSVRGVRDPKQLLLLGGMNWKVKQLAMVGVLPPVAPEEYADTIECPTHVLNVRDDNNGILGVVGKNYKPFDNEQIADLLVAALGEGVEMDTVGTLQGGRRVFFMVRGGSFAIGKSGNDITTSDLMVAAGHDGSLALNGFFTSQRVVCKNTMRRALSGRKGGFAIRHEGDMMSKVHDIQVALGLVQKTLTEAHDEASMLNAKEMTREQLQRFWLDVYSRAEGEIPAAPTTDAEVRAKEKAESALAMWGMNFDRDRQVTGNGATAWTALNSVTEWYDHQRSVKGRDDRNRQDNRIISNMWGLSFDRKEIAREAALALL